MSSLSNIDKRYLESILEMRGGYVLNFSDSTFGEFFSGHKIDIHGSKYQKYGTSKAKKMRAFWELEPDYVVAPVLSEMLAVHETECDLAGVYVDQKILDKSKSIVARISGATSNKGEEKSEDAFLNQEFKIPNLHKLPVEPQVAKLIEQRLNEARAALKAKAHLSVIFLCGSVLEGVLLGAAQGNPDKFNRAKSSPTNSNGKVKPFQDWSLSQFIDVACEAGFLKLDVKKFGHGLRDFRNYIHPYEQLVSGFSPDEHTAKVCFQVLKAALASLSGER